MRRILLGSAAAVAALAVIPAVQASHDASKCGVPADSIYNDLGYSPSVITIGAGQAGDGSLYIDDRDFATGNGFWIFQETSDLGGLQRGGESLMGEDLGGHDGCPSGALPDTVVL